MDLYIATVSGLQIILIIVKHLRMNRFLTLFGDSSAISPQQDGFFIISFVFCEFFLYRIRLYCIDRFAYDLVRKRRDTISAATKEKKSEENEDSQSGYRDLLSLYIEKGLIFLPFVSDFLSRQ